jgi:excisionase family DNA binding protein|tara:strand:+ start:471 stop:683 length:213 start_codon:yes stop_codon:yes gene_type:complete
VEKLFTKRQAAEYFQVSQRTIDRLITKLDIPVFKIGRQVRIPESSIELMMQKVHMTVEERHHLLSGMLEE